MTDDPRQGRDSFLFGPGGMPEQRSRELAEQRARDAAYAPNGCLTTVRGTSPIRNMRAVMSWRRRNMCK